MNLSLSLLQLTQTFVLSAPSPAKTTSLTFSLNSLHCYSTMATTSNSVLFLSSDSLIHHHHHQPLHLSSSRSHSVSLPPNKRSNSLTLRCSTNGDSTSTEKETPIELSKIFLSISNVSDIRHSLTQSVSLNPQNSQHFQR